MSESEPESVAGAAPLPPRQALQQRVAEAILAAAASTFAVAGERANLGDVAAAAGVARATVYRYFPNRERLLAELSRVTLAAAEERLAAARIDEVPVEEGVTRAIRVFIELGDAFVLLVRERSPESTEFDRVVIAPLRRVLERGRSSGSLRRDIPTTWLAESLVGVVASVQRHGSLGRDDTVAATAALFLEGAGATRAGD